MEVLFENSYTRNKEYTKEIYRHYYFQSPFMVVFYVIMGLSLMSSIAAAVIYGDYDWGPLITFLLIFLLQYYRYSMNVKMTLRRDIEAHGKAVSVEIVVTEEYIQNTASSGSVIKLEYDRIKDVNQTKNLILLRSKANLLYTFRKDSFTKGTKEEFIEFMKRKGIKVK